MTRGTAPLAVAAGSLVLLAGLAAALYWRGAADRPGTAPPLVVYAAAAVRPPVEAIADEYERETGRRVERHYGASEDMLARAALADPAAPADLFLPADDSYVDLARARGLVGDTFPVARMRPVLLLAPGNPKQIAAWPDLLRPGVTVAVPNPAAAVGKLARDHLTQTGRWDALRPRAADTGTVTEAANAAKVGSADAAVVWDAVAAQPAYAGQTVLHPPELAGVTAHVRVAVLKQARDADAARGLARFLTADRGLQEFRARGFDVIEAGGAK